MDLNRLLATGLVLIALPLTSPTIASSDAVIINRYMEVETGPRPDQLDLLSPVLVLELDSDVRHVGDAVRAVLEGSGYQLSSRASDRSEREPLFNFALPASHRSLGPMSLREALWTLAGAGWMVIEDPKNRLVTFRRCVSAEQRGGRTP